MIDVKIRGVLYPLRLDLRTMELMDEKYGDAQELLTAFEKKRTIKDLKRMFWAMANSARHYMKQKEDVPEEVLDHADMAEISGLADAVNREMKRTMHVRGADGAEDGDGRLDVFDAQMGGEDRKNAEAGGGSASESSTPSP